MPNYDIYFHRWLSHYTFYKWQNMALMLNRNFICGSFNKQQQHNFLELFKNSRVKCI